MKNFPPFVWATAFAALIAFMGIGIVDPILPIIGKEMGATTFQVEWLFTSHIGMMALAMLISGVLATMGIGGGMGTAVLFEKSRLAIDGDVFFNNIPLLSPIFFRP
jgi:MFS family permease